ncbi:MAG: arylsulfatase, partial [Phycisphaerales bacterium]|nr:arylsulfatase [Phycisphaerales bacterium]
AMTFVVGVLFACTPRPAARPTDAMSLAPPNILLIVADDQGWNDVGYHNPEIRSPNLDRLAGTGVELDCHYVQPQCTPTRVALMTGRYPSRFGRHATTASNEPAFPIGTPTLATVLRSAGYATGMSGKWHLGSKPEWGPAHHGFDHSHGSLAGAVGMYDHRYRLGSPYEVTWHRDHQFITEEGHVTDLTARETVQWIETHSDGQPWFFYVAFHAVHTPLVERGTRWADANRHIDDEERRLFAAAVTHMDWAVGRMVHALERTGQRDRTLIVFTSDNGAQVDHAGGQYPPPDPKLTGFSSNAPLRGRKTHVFEGGYRVPAFAHWPGTLVPRRVTRPMHAVDWMPTLAARAGAALPHGTPIDGHDAWPLLTARPEERSPTPRMFYITWGGANRVALRHGRWKVVRNGRDAEWMLFDLDADPLERENRKDDEPEIFQQLMRMVEAQRALDADDVRGSPRAGAKPRSVK